MDVLSSCLAIPSLFRPWMTCGILSQEVIVPQVPLSSSRSPRPRAPIGLTGALCPAITIIASRIPPSISCTCVADILRRKAQTVLQQWTGLAPLMGCRWNSDCLHLPHLPHLLLSHHTFRHLAARCTPLPSSIPTLSHSDGENQN